MIVALSIGLYFRRLRAIPLDGHPGGRSAPLWPSPTAELAFGYLNSSTAFLGLDHPRQRDQLRDRADVPLRGAARARRRRPTSARARAGRVWRGTLVAAIARVGRLRVADGHQLPRLLSVRRHGRGRARCSAGSRPSRCCRRMLVAARPHGGAATRARRAAPLELGPLGALVRRAAAASLLAFAALAIVGRSSASRHFLQDPFEYDFRKLNAQLEHDRGGPAVRPEHRQAVRPLALADHRPGRHASSEVEPIEAAIRAPGRGAPPAAEARHRPDRHHLRPAARARPRCSGASWRCIAQIRKLTHDPALAVLTTKERKPIWPRSIRPTDLHELAPMDLPPLARRPFTEVDGTVGRVVLVYPPEQGLSVWNGRDLLRIAAVLQHLHLAERQGDRDLGRGGGVRRHDPLDPARRPHRHGRLAAGRR